MRFKRCTFAGQRVNPQHALSSAFGMLCYLDDSLMPLMRFLFVHANFCSPAYFRPPVTRRALAACYTRTYDSVRRTFISLEYSFRVANGPFFLSLSLVALPIARIGHLRCPFEAHTKATTSMLLTSHGV